nr:MFS transporter [Legionella hackeliae]
MFYFFAYSTNEIQLIIGRFAMGASASFSLTGAQTIIRMYFSDRLFPIFSGLTLTVGVIGAIVGGLPLIEASRYEGWRIIMQYAGCGSITLAFLLYLFLGKKKQLHNSEYDFKHLMKDFKQFLKTRRAWLPGIYGGLMLSPIIAFASFWAAPFLITHYNYSLEFAEFLASFVFIGYACGSPAHALLAEKVGLKKSDDLSPNCSDYLYDFAFKY